MSVTDTDLAWLCNKPQDWLVQCVQLLCQLLLLLRACLKPYDQAGDLVGTIPAPGLSLCSLHIQRPSAQQHTFFYRRDRQHDPWLLSTMHAAVIDVGVISARKGIPCNPPRNSQTDGTSLFIFTDAGTQAVQECHASWSLT